MKLDLAFLSNSQSIGLDKDNREAISFNYQINLLQENAKFVTFSNLFGDKKSRLKMCLLNKEVSLFDETIDITDVAVIADNVTYQLVNNANAIEVKITPPVGINLSEVNSVFVYEDDDAERYFLLYRKFI